MSGTFVFSSYPTSLSRRFSQGCLQGFAASICAGIGYFPFLSVFRILCLFLYGSKITSAPVTLGWTVSGRTGHLRAHAEVRVLWPGQRQVQGPREGLSFFCDQCRPTPLNIRAPSWTPEGPLGPVATGSETKRLSNTANLDGDSWVVAEMTRVP